MFDQVHDPFDGNNPFVDTIVRLEDSLRETDSFEEGTKIYMEWLPVDVSFSHVEDAGRMLSETMAEIFGQLIDAELLTLQQVIQIAVSHGILIGFGSGQTVRNG